MCVKHLLSSIIMLQQISKIQKTVVISRQTYSEETAQYELFAIFYVAIKHREIEERFAITIQTISSTRKFIMTRRSIYRLYMTAFKIKNGTLKNDQNCYTLLHRNAYTCIYVCIVYRGNLIANCQSRETHEASSILHVDQNT